jgi:hypothetical protein
MTEMYLSTRIIIAVGGVSFVALCLLRVGVL